MKQLVLLLLLIPGTLLVLSLGHQRSEPSSEPPGVSFRDELPLKPLDAEESVPAPVTTTPFLAEALTSRRDTLVSAKDIAAASPTAAPAATAKNRASFVGRFVEEHGQPLTGVNIALVSDAPERRVLSPWVASQPDGRFSLEINDNLERPPLAVVSGPLHYLPHPVAVFPGAEQVIRVVRGGSIAGRILLPAGVPSHGVRVVISGFSARAAINREGENSDEAVVIPDSGGRFRTDGLPAGAVRVAVHQDPSLPPLWFKDGVKIRPGVALAPEDLSAIDLRNAFEWREVRTFSPDGDYVAQVFVEVFAPGRRRAIANGHTDERGVFRYPSGGNPIDLVVRTPKGLTERRANVGANVEFTIRPRFEIDIRFATPLPKGGPPYFAIRAAPRDPRAPDSEAFFFGWGSPTPLTQDNEARLAIFEDCPHRFEIVLQASPFATTGFS